MLEINRVGGTSGIWRVKLKNSLSIFETETNLSKQVIYGVCKLRDLVDSCFD